MKAMVFRQYGSPDVVKQEELEKPVPKENEVVIKVIATSINPLDWHIMRGEPFLARFGTGLVKPNKMNILGADVAGIVETVGAQVKQFKQGDEVIGELGEDDLGGLAEFACGSEQSFVLKPANSTFEEAAAMPVAALTALQGIRDYGFIKEGQNVLVNGASGGVGHFAVQLCKFYGTEVTGVCSTRNQDLVKSIGADHVVDYTQTDFTITDQKYDLIICAVGNRKINDYKQALTPDGRCVIIGFTTMGLMIHQALRGNLKSKKHEKKAGMMGVAQASQMDMQFIVELMKKDAIRPVIDSVYPLKEAAEAIRYLEKGHARGKVIITMC